jgi:hypothetical protein
MTARTHNAKPPKSLVVPSGYETKEMKYWKDYAVKLDELPVINPGPVRVCACDGRL